MNLKPLLKYSLSVCLGALIALFVVYMMKDNEIKFVKMSKVFAESKIKKAYQKELSDFEKQSNAQLGELQQIVKKKQMAGAPESEIGPLQSDLKRMQDQLSEQYAKKSDDFQAAIWSELNKRIEDYGKQMGYRYILGANGDGSIMFADEGEDITEQVIEFVNK